MSIVIEELGSEEKNNNKKTNKKDNEVSVDAVQSLRQELAELKSEINSNASSGNNNSDITALVTEMRKKSDEEKYGGEYDYVNTDDIDLKDHLKEGVTFFAHKVGYVIVDDMRKGHPVRTPFGNKIVFKYQSTKRVRGGKEVSLHNLSGYTSYSQKEVDWLKDHKFYGILFFNSHTQALSVDAKKAAKLARVMAGLNNIEPGRIVTMAQGLGITPMEDIHMLRMLIADNQAASELAKEEENNKIRVKEAIIERNVLT